MVLFEFKKGNPERLEGRLLVYTHNLDTCNHSGCDRTKYFAVYARAEFIERPDLIKTLKKINPKNHDKEVLDLYIDVKRKANNLDKLVRVHTGDIIDAGEIFCSLLSYPILRSTVETYMLNYLTQQHTKLISSHHYTSYTPKDFKIRFCKMVRALLNSVHEGHINKTERITQNIKEFTREAPFSLDIENMTNLSQTSIKDRSSIIWLYALKITSIMDEEYEKAAEYDKRINNLLIQTPKSL